MSKEYPIKCYVNNELLMSNRVATPDTIFETIEGLMVQYPTDHTTITLIDGFVEIVLHKEIEE